MAILRKKIKGSTLPEVLTALAIIMICSALMMQISSNLYNNLSFNKVVAADLANKVIEETIAKKSFIDEEISEAALSIKKECIKSTNYQNCIEIKITVFNAKKQTVLKLNRIVNE